MNKDDVREVYLDGEWIGTVVKDGSTRKRFDKQKLTPIITVIISLLIYFSVLVVGKQFGLVEEIFLAFLISEIEHTVLGSQVVTKKLNSLLRQ